MKEYQCDKCGYNTNGICQITFMDIEQVKNHLGNSPCASKYEKPAIPAIIGICGYARAGKDTAADIICRNIAYLKMSFANILKKECNTMMKSVGERIDLHNESDKVRYRDLLVFWGKFRREKFRDDYWIDMLAYDIKSRHLDEGPARGIVISDVRYPNEAEWIRDNSGIIIHIRRPGTGWANSEERRTIQQIEDSDLIDFDLPNDGDISLLEARILNILWQG